MCATLIGEQHFRYSSSDLTLIRVTIRRFLTTPLLLLDLMLTVRVPWPTIVFTVVMDWIMIGEFAIS